MLELSFLTVLVGEIQLVQYIYMNLQLESADYDTCDIEIGYSNWSAEEILKAVLPDDIPNVTGFSIVGHVAHLNLRDSHSPYKSLIG